MEKFVWFMFFVLFPLNAKSQPFIEYLNANLPNYTDAGIIIGGDYNNDGKMDLLSSGWVTNPTNYFSRIFKNIGDSSFLNQSSISLTSAYMGECAWGDYNNDNYLDFIITGMAPEKTILYRNNGDGTFSEQTSGNLQPIADGTVVWGDINNDGYLDILLCGKNIGTKLMKLYKNKKNGTFTDITNTSIIYQDNPNYVGFIDYDSDGYLDLLVSSSNVTKLFKNNGNGYFAENTYIVFPGSNKFFIGDYTNDGYLDILLFTIGDTAKLYRNNGGKGFAEQVSILPQVLFKNPNAVWGDYNNDGLLDVAINDDISTTTPNVRTTILFKNTGSNSFLKDTTFLAYASTFCPINLADINNDGRLDLLTGNSGKVYKNMVNKINKAPSAPSNLQAIVSSGMVTFKWDKASDNETPQAGLSYNIYIYEEGKTGFKLTPQAFTQSDFNNGLRMIVKPGAIQYNSNGYTIWGLPYGKYKWSVQAVDGGYMGGKFANESSFVQGLKISGTVKANNILVSAAKVFLFKKSNPSLVIDSTSLTNGSYQFNNILPDSYGIFVVPQDTLVNDYNITFYGGKLYLSDASYLEVSGDVSGVEINFISKTDLTIQTASLNVADDAPVFVAKWRKGNCDRSIVFIAQTTIGKANPKDKLTYTANSEFGKGSQIDETGWYCVYNGVGDSVSITGLILVDSLYRIMVAEYYGILGNERYNQDTAKNNIKNFRFPLFSAQKEISKDVNQAFIWGDYDNDNDLDLLMCNSITNVMKLYQNNNGKLLQSDNTFDYSGGHAEWGDYNNDGNIDILLSTGVVYLNNGNHFFTKIWPTINLYSNGVWCDYNNDGKLDYSAGIDSVRIFKNVGDDKFVRTISLGLGYGIKLFKFFDYDNDGWNDLLVYVSNGQVLGNVSITSIFKNTDGNSFTKQAFNLGKTESIAFADFNNDGFIDLVKGSTDLNMGYTSSSLIKNEQGLGFSSISTPPKMGVGSYSFANFDNDSYIDLISCGHYCCTSSSLGSDVSNLYQNNNGNFLKINTSPLQNLKGYAVWGDYNGDNKLDLIISGENTTATTTPPFLQTNYYSILYKNNTKKVNTLPQSPSNLHSTIDKFSVTLYWDIANDAETPRPSLTYNMYIGNHIGRTDILSPIADLTSGFRKIVENGNCGYTNSKTLRLLPGKYYWSVQTIDNCYAASQFAPVDSFEVTYVETSNPKVKKESSVSIYPNPTNGVIKIINPDTKILLVEVYDAFGKLILKDNCNSGENILDISSFSSGMYFLKLTGQKVKTEKIILFK